MPEVLPFRGIRYAASRGAALGRLLSPPYDVVSPAERDALAARSPHNIVHVILERDREGDAAGENKYVRSARAWNAWLQDGTLHADPEPAVYPLEQSFTGPDGRPRVRRGLVAVVRLHEYAEGLVLPHERTLTGPKLDRLAVLRNVQANLSPIFALYEDDDRVGGRAVEAAMNAAQAIAEAETDDRTLHRLWRVTDREALADVRRVLAERTIFIADGHHRYESALAYRDEVDAERPGLGPYAGHRFVMMTLVSMSDPGVVIYPTHRLVRGISSLDLRAFLEGLARYFVVDTLREDLRRPAGRAWAVSKLAEHAGKSTTFLVVTAEDGKGRILTLRDDADLSGVPMPANVTVRDLDVTALHAIVFQHLLGVSARAQEAGEEIRYELDAGEVVTRTLAGEYQVGVLVNPTPMWQVQAVAESGDTMPQKSTFFYPKLASGLVMRRIHDDLTP